MSTPLPIIPPAAPLGSHRRAAALRLRAALTAHLAGATA